jgi:hypothetical protein
MELLGKLCRNRKGAFRGLFPVAPAVVPGQVIEHYRNRPDAHALVRVQRESLEMEKPNKNSNGAVGRIIKAGPEAKMEIPDHPYGRKEEK